MYIAKTNFTYLFVILKKFYFISDYLSFVLLGYIHYNFIQRIRNMNTSKQRWNYAGHLVIKWYY